MTLSFKQADEIRHIISMSLDEAERNWSQVGGKLVKAAMDSISLEESVESLIPNNEIVFDGIPRVEQFVALVVDMRGSSRRLNTIESRNHVNGFQRVYYETSALLPALTKTISYENGSVTEFLGDGVLALFPVSNPPGDQIKAAYRAAENCVGEVRDLVNEALLKRYNLLPMSLGAGLALGHTMITIVGYGRNVQPKALGSCIYEAAKLSGGTNEVMVSESMHGAWPKAVAGKGSLKFNKCTMKSVTGFSVKRI